MPGLPGLPGLPPLDWRTKGLPPGAAAMDVADLATLGWNVLAGDTGSPVAVLLESALTRNLATMRAFCAEHDVSIAPHAKTHMSPELVDRQRRAGAWGLSAAVPHQVAALVQWGVRRVLIANQVTDPGALRWLAQLLRDDPTLEVFWYVDSRRGVELAESACAAAGGDRPATLLLEVGHRDGRTGARTLSAALEVAAAVDASAHLSLVGVAGYEGTIGRDRSPATRSAVTEFLDLIGEVYVAVDDAGVLAGGQRIVTAGGSVFFDLVALALAPLRARGAIVVLRSGCYLTHDDGFYEQVSPDLASDWSGDEFAAAIEVWGRVLSRPEPGLALLNLGRRGALRAATGMTVTALGDQHAWLSVPADDGLDVGDLVGVGVSHPCTTFDKWPLLMLVDDARTVVGGVRTFF